MKNKSLHESILRVINETDSLWLSRGEPNSMPYGNNRYDRPEDMDQPQQYGYGFRRGGNIGPARNAPAIKPQYNTGYQSPRPRRPYGNISQPYSTGYGFRSTNSEEPIDTGDLYAYRYRRYRRY